VQGDDETKPQWLLYRLRRLSATSSLTGHYWRVHVSRHDTVNQPAAATRELLCAGLLHRLLEAGVDVRFADPLAIEGLQQMDVAGGFASVLSRQ
jgi:hypothetical protein